MPAGGSLQETELPPWAGRGCCRHCACGGGGSCPPPKLRFGCYIPSRRAGRICPSPPGPVLWSCDAYLVVVRHPVQGLHQVSRPLEQHFLGGERQEVLRTRRPSALFPRKPAAAAAPCPPSIRAPPPPHCCSLTHEHGVGPGPRSSPNQHSCTHRLNTGARNPFTAQAPRHVPPRGSAVVCMVGGGETVRRAQCMLQAGWCLCSCLAPANILQQVLSKAGISTCGAVKMSPESPANCASLCFFWTWLSTISPQAFATASFSFLDESHPTQLGTT